MIKQAIQFLAQHVNLPLNIVQDVMDEIMEGKASDIQVAAYLTAMSVKGETIEEITASAIGMRKHYTRLFQDMDVLEIVGTGGDGTNSFNISTTAAFVISATGIHVAKHGNHAATSKSGAADVLEALGANITISTEASLEILKKVNICFLFNKNYPPAMKCVAAIRHELDILTLFNKLRWLNLSGSNMELLGVYSKELVEPMAKVLSNLGVKRAMVVYGQDGIDEISVSANTIACEVRDGFTRSFEIKPDEFGIPRYKKSEILGGMPTDNAVITRNILSGCEMGAKRDIVLINSAVGIHLARPEYSIGDALKLARDVIDSGAALKNLDKFVTLTNEF